MSQNGHAILWTEAIMTAVPHAITALPPAAIRTRNRKERARPLVAGQRKCERGRESAEAQGASKRGEVNQLGSLHGRYFRAGTLRRQRRWGSPRHGMARHDVESRLPQMMCGDCAAKDGIVDAGG
jgi:hypothetical protein